MLKHFFSSFFPFYGLLQNFYSPMLLLGQQTVIRLVLALPFVQLLSLQWPPFPLLFNALFLVKSSLHPYGGMTACWLINQSITCLHLTALQGLHLTPNSWIYPGCLRVLGLRHREGDPSRGAHEYPSSSLLCGL